MQILQRVQTALSELQTSEAPTELQIKEGEESLDVVFTPLYSSSEDSFKILADVVYIYRNSIRLHELFFCDSNANLSQRFLRGVVGTEFFKALAKIYSTVIFFTEDNGFPTFTIVDGNLFSMTFNSTKEVDYADFNDYGDLKTQVKSILKYFASKAIPGSSFLEKHEKLAAILEGIQDGSIKRVPADMLEKFNQSLRESQRQSFATPNKQKHEDDKPSTGFTASKSFSD